MFLKLCSLVIYAGSLLGRVKFTQIKLENIHASTKFFFMNKVLKSCLIRVGFFYGDELKEVKVGCAFK